MVRPVELVLRVSFWSFRSVPVVIYNSDRLVAYIYNRGSAGTGTVPDYEGSVMSLHDVEQVLFCKRTFLWTGLVKEGAVRLRIAVWIDPVS